MQEGRGERRALRQEGKDIEERKKRERIEERAGLARGGHKSRRDGREKG